MEILPTGNFFEVTINSQKLLSFVEQINKQINFHHLELEQLSKRITNIANNASLKAKQEGQIQIQLQKIRRMNQQENNYLRLYMKDSDKKSGQKIGELQNSMVVLSNRINTVREAIEEDFTIKLSYIQKKLNNVPTVEDLSSKFNEQLLTLKASIIELSGKQEKSMEQTSNQLRRISQINQKLSQKISHNEQERKTQNQQFFSMRTSIQNNHINPPKQKRKNRRGQKQGAAYQQQMSGVLAKIEGAETRLAQNGGINSRRSILSNSRIIKTNQNITNVMHKSQFSTHNEDKMKEFQQTITSKLQKIQELAGTRVNLLEKELIRISNKNQIVDEHIGILSRKLEKQKFKVGEIAENVKKYDDKKIDQKVIEGLKTLIKKISKDLEEALELRLTKEAFDKQRIKMNERIHFINQLVIEKAQKSQVKKGFTFLEEKIKQIIIVLTEERNACQDGAIKRVPFKCLSCDKDLQAQKSQLVNPQTLKGAKQNQSSAMRLSTNQLRKRIRMINNTVSTVTLNDD